MKSDDRVVASACQCVDLARFAMPRYGRGKIPLTTAEVSRMLAQLNCHLEVFPFPGDDIAFTLPRVRGLNVICLNRSAHCLDRRLAIRHEIGHVLADEVAEPTYMSETDAWSDVERSADLFALVDLIPPATIRLVRSLNRRWAGVLEELRDMVALYAEFWPEERIQDRAELRLRLYRRWGM